MNVVMLRFFFVYGAGQKRNMLIPRLVDNIQACKVITLQGEDGIKINPVHVSDAVQAIQAAVNLQGCHRINVAGPAILSLREICDTIGSKVGVQPIFEVNQTTSPGNLIADIESMKKLLVTPMCRFDSGILDLI
jgi:UDP-glucose 4-epimerase